MVSTRILCRPFVGRAIELEHLLLRRRQAGDGHGGLVLVGGEPGIGKSRLVREFKERLNRHTSATASSACREFAQKPLGPIVEILEQLARVGASDLACATRDEQLDVIAGTLERVAAKRTSVALLEDLHWADVDLMQTLLVLVRRATNKRLLFVGTYRDNELSTSHPLFKWFGSLIREPATSVISLPRFEQAELDRLMELAVSGTATLSIPVLHAVRARSDGNPLFAEELLRSAVDSQRAGLSGSLEALPLSLRALVEERLQECTDRERSLLRRASLFGRYFSVERICEIFGEALPDVQPMLDRLSNLQLLDAEDAERGAYRFRHALTRDAVYGEMQPDAARPLHLTIAEHLERIGATEDDEALAHHFWQAGSRERAAPYYERAGDSAMAIFAYDDAATFYQRAADGFEHEDAACARVCACAARALIFAGELDAGLVLYERAVAIATNLGDIAEVVRYRALMAGHLFDGGRRDAAIASLRDTLTLAERGEPALSSRLRTRLAMTLARDSRLDEAWNELQKIDAFALDAAAETTGEYYLCAAELLALRGELDEWQIRFSKGVAVYETLGHPGPTQVAHANFAVQALCVGETELARTHHRIAIELARTLRFDDQPILLAQVELFAGNLAQARLIVDAMAPPRRFLMRAMLAQVALPLAIALGDRSMLERHLDESLLAQTGSSPLSAPLARVAAAHALALATMNRRREAQTLSVRVLESLQTAFGMTLPVVAIVTLLPERACELRSLLEAAAKPVQDRVGKALLALAAGDAAGAAKRFSTIGWPLLEARALEMAGERDAARAIYVRCGAAGDVRRLEFASASSAAGTSLGVLTARERELALQVAAGKANRAVAEALSIGEKTVEKYLTSIYAKLGLTSRAQLAALVAGTRQPVE